MMQKTKKIVTFGEVMMRLSPPGHAKFSQVTSLDIDYGGGEANVAIALAYMGMKACHVTRLPDNLIGRSATQYLRHHWIDTDYILYGDSRMGLYFLEKGAVHRSSEVVYEREDSAFSKIHPEMIKWEEVLQGADWFHWTGITPAVSIGAAKSCLKAIQVANDLGIMVSGDIHSRKSLWKYGLSKQEIIPELVAGSNIVIASTYDMYDIFNIGQPDADFATSAKALQKKFPLVQKIIDKDREVISASHNRIKGKMWNGKEFLTTPFYDVTHIVDRVGTGDAYAAGLIFGLANQKDDKEALNFAAATCALKHTVEGDANMVSQEDVEVLVRGSGLGEIKR
ncbi:2-dehydro-3-deoxygluconokinase [Hyunsoonleella jejuensis]|uniref:2-dehydro-3-deoxygluconokinase n=1 Tax=Hyunsoonleella jejuensis TaxID=419940 RepID=A0A1H9KPI3_9FLAO|nr:sugar kinase [Hyunsoonleella jejuensis]SER00827.1 2-dehydro-3-deoxygluconokinase [Hyunsoonleella jejuensis]